MKMRTAEFLAVVAIVSSAAALQLREHVQFQDTSAEDAQPASATLCGISRNGVIPAACESMRGNDSGDDHAKDGARPQELEHAPKAARIVPQVWV